MDSSRPDSLSAGQAEPRDLLIDYDPTPPTSPQTPQLSQHSTAVVPNMQSYCYHRGHQSLDNGRGNLRAGSTPLGPPTSENHQAFQRDPRFVQWRAAEQPMNPPTTDDLRLMVSIKNGSTPVTNVASGKYAYCLDRGNGRVTRLIPADMLPALKEIPRWEMERAGMTVLPMPTGPLPADVAATNRMCTLQGRRQPMSSPHKADKEKVYCTKWIHDGTCAFSHPGCRFKHVMPMDRETQLEVGLFNGLPPWWKKKQSQLNRHAQRQSGVDVSVERLSLTEDNRAAPENGLAGSVPDVPMNWRKGESSADQRTGLRSSRFAGGAIGSYYKPEPIAPPRREKK